jgi:hydrogenase-4 component B
MLSLLEVGAVAILLALPIIATHTGSCEFAGFRSARLLSGPRTLLLALLLLFGFGAKLCVLRSTSGSPPRTARAAAQRNLSFRESC